MSYVLKIYLTTTRILKQSQHIISMATSSQTGTIIIIQLFVNYMSIRIVEVVSGYNFFALGFFKRIFYPKRFFIIK